MRARAVEFAGGTGEPNNPYQIATAEQLIAIGSDPNLLNKHFILVADINLDPNLPGRRVFDQPVIGAAATGFSGSFDGRGRTIANMHIVGQRYHAGGISSDTAEDTRDLVKLPYASLFKTILPEGCVNNLNLRDAWVDGGRYVAALAVENQGTLINCRVKGVVSGLSTVGGLVATNKGLVACSHADVEVTGGYGLGSPGGSQVGGLIGLHERGLVTHCSAQGHVCGRDRVGGLVGECWAQVVNCNAAVDITSLAPGIRTYTEELAPGWSMGGLAGYCQMPPSVHGLQDGYAIGSITAGRSSRNIGGLVGEMFCPLVHCYAATRVAIGETSQGIGGLVGYTHSRDVQACYFLDPNDGGGPINKYGTPLTQAQMMREASFVGWDFAGETANGTEDIWWIDEGKDYPRLWWEKCSGGSGTADDPYRIATVADLIALGETPADYGKHFVLTADIDLDPNLPGRKVFDRAPIAPDVNDLQYNFQGTAFAGTFDGGGHAIRNLTIADPNHDYLGLFGMIAVGGQVSNLALEDVEISGGRHSINVGTLAGYNAGTLAECSATGIAIGCGNVRALAGSNSGTITNCHAEVSVHWLCE
jgi:hypothetical protein